MGYRNGRVVLLSLLLSGLLLTDAVAQGAGAAETTETPAAAAVTPQEPATTAASTAETSSLPQWAFAFSLLSFLGVAYLIVVKPWSRGQSKRRRYAPAEGEVPAPAPVRAAPPAAPARPQPQVPTEDRGLSNKQLRQVREVVQEELRRPPSARPIPKQAPATKATPAPPVARQQPVAPPPAPVQQAPTPPPAPEPEDLFVVPAPEELYREPVPAPAPARPLVQYVNQVPVSGMFPRHALTDNRASYTIFEITINPEHPDKATFAVNSDPSSHAGHISSHSHTLEPAAEYSLPNGNVSRIVTEKPGELQRNGNGDWQILRKARLRFE